MITKKEIEAISLDPTKRDFYQVWNELIDTARAISNIWDPSSTNEADPGIVLLKVLTGIADKLNYTIDKNTLEAFMPSATQEESMRKLCEMCGYTMKYYQSATTTANIAYVGTEYDLADGYFVYIPKFTNIKNNDDDINYVTLDEIWLNESKTAETVDIIEGELVEYEDITIDQLDDNNRYFLPEYQIAENGIFLTSLDDATTTYKKVDNLNSHELGQTIWKFGFDSQKNEPYIQFPADISSMIGSGISFRYVRTNGANGNIAARTLSVIEASGIKVLPASYSSEDDAISASSEWLTATNSSAAMNGRNKETIDEAYNSYKKIVGTFDTLVTCRDYMNKIYNLTVGDIDGSSSTNPLVSNVIVSDIRDDINRGATVCSFSANGATYKNVVKSGKTISHFDLLLYPFKPVRGLNTKSEYDASFKFSDENWSEIEAGIAECKTMSHSIVEPDNDEIACIKNYVKLNASITTTKKVNALEQASILKNVFSSLYAAFNMRKVDFGEEITNSMISKVIMGADTRIKNVSISTKDEIRFCQKNGLEMSASDSGYSDTFINLAVLNVLAGRVSLFKYNEEFKPTLHEAVNDDYDDMFYPGSKSFGGNSGIMDNAVLKIETKYEPVISSVSSNNPLKLTSNELIQFRAPNFKTTTTYPSYVNYYFHKANQTGAKVTAIPATFMLLKTFLETGELEDFVNSDGVEMMKFSNKKTETAYYTYNELTAKYVWIFDINAGDGKYKKVSSADYSATTAHDYYFVPLTDADNFAELNNFIKAITYEYEASDGTTKTANMLGLYKQLATDTTRVIGRYVDSGLNKYVQTNVVVRASNSSTSNVYTDCKAWVSMYVQNTCYETTESQTYDGIGRDADLTGTGVAAGSEYLLLEGDYLLINYTSTSTSDSGDESSTIINKEYIGGDGVTIIKPNFDLYDSNVVSTQQSKSWSKKSGFAFGANQPAGMFTLASNEQIEIREPVVITIGPKEDSTEKSSIVNLFWIRSDDAKNTDSDTKALHFKWTDDEKTTSVEKPDGTTETITWNSSYTLRENEYFFYTDKNKTDLAYYGSGTKIVRSSYDLELIRDTSKEEELTTDEIMQYGLQASIPWITRTLTKERNITLHEYQYINLIEDDKLTKIEGDDIGSTLTHEWVKVKSAAYHLKGDDAETLLPDIRVGDDSWEVRSVLQLNCGPAKTQTLGSSDHIIVYQAIEDKENNPATWKYYDETTGYPINDASHTPSTWKYKSIADFMNVSVESNVALCTSSNITELSAFAECRFKAFDISEATIGTGADEVAIDEGNFKNGVTKVSLTGDVKLSLAIPNEHFGMMMFYVEDSSGATSSTLDIVADGLEVKDFISNADVEKLKVGMNTLKITSAAGDHTLTIKADGSGNFTLCFSGLDLVEENKEINPKLGIPQTSYDDVLAKIHSIDADGQFWYNCMIDNSLAITMNDADEDDDLASADSWYDYNNVCNKFVITELDSDYFTDGGIIFEKECIR